MKKFWIVFLILALIVTGTLVVFWRLMRSLEARGPEVEGGVLVWKVAEEYGEDRDDSLVSYLLQGQPMLMREVVFALHRAAEDSDIEGLLLHIQAVPLDWAKVEELQAAVRRFAASGKSVVAYLEGGGTREYALAVVADRLILAPEGNLMVLGVSAELTFLKDTLDKLGMQADFVHVGKYKSAPETLTRSGSSPASREMIEAIVDERYRVLVDMVATGRRTGPDRARQWIDTGFYDAPSALAAGLVDTTLSLEEVLTTSFATERRTDLADYALVRRGGRPANRIALIYAAGTIIPGESRRESFGGKYVGSDTVIEQLRDARQDRRIAAVLLRVDSPGGSALASDLIWQEIARVRQEKPVVVSMSGYAASGGYYIACGADSIFAEPGTLTGSIGVFAGKIDMHGFYDKIGIQREFITRGENALFMSDQATFTPAQRERFTSLLEQFYRRFLQKVADGRDLSPEQVAAVAQGRVWTGQQAVQHRLVDGLGGLNRALDSAKLMIGLSPADRVALITYEWQPSFLERLLLKSLRESTAQAPALSTVPGALLKVSRELTDEGVLAALPLLDGRPLAMVPFRVQFR